MSFRAYVVGVIFPLWGLGERGAGVDASLRAGRLLGSSLLRARFEEVFDAAEEVVAGGR